MRATARQRDGLVHTVEIDGHEIVVDEPIDVGGTDTAPSPTRLVTAALAACTALPVGLYADQRGRIMVIAGKCPVHRILASDVEIVTIERPAAP